MVASSRVCLAFARNERWLKKSAPAIHVTRTKTVLRAFAAVQTVERAFAIARTHPGRGLVVLAIPEQKALAAAAALFVARKVRSPAARGTCASDMTGCNPTGDCQEVGQECADAEDCCEGLLCDSGACIESCQGVGDECGEGGACCDGLVCDSGTCFLVACRPLGEECGGEAGECCNGLVCDSNTCIEESCQNPGQECSGDDERCAGSSCMEGVCACLTASEPWLGCDCDTGTEAPCGGGTVICCPSGAEPGGSGVCTNASVGCETPPLCIAPGDACSEEDDRCCVGSCMSGICACEDPSEPWLGCPCYVGGEAVCDSRPDLCCSIGQAPSDPGICVSPMTGCNPTGECAAEPGQTCRTDQDCCEGKCSNDGICYCADPAEPLRGCSCHTGTADPCGADSLLCCATTTTLGGPGICTPDRLGCEPVGTCTDKGGHCHHDDECCDALCCVDGGLRHPAAAAEASETG